jgi:hypothetical protein
MLCALRADPAAAGCKRPASASAAPSPSPPAQPPLYDLDKDILSVDRDTALYYSFRSNLDGSAQAEKELRYDRNLWNTCAQLEIRLPFITVYPSERNSDSANGNPFSGFGNAELRYSYRVDSSPFSHAIAIGLELPTAGDGVQSIDTELKFLYATKWKWNGGSIAYTNEYDQTVVRPPGATYTSYYQGTLAAPNYSFVDSPAWKGLKISALYEYRVLFNNGGTVNSAVGAIINGNLNDVAFNAIDTWGTGAHGLWRYRVEATAAVRF